MKVQDKVFVVTGAGSGIGQELTKQLVAKGAMVAMADISEEGLIETEKIVDTSRVSRHIIDISDQTAVQNFPKKVIDAHGQVDALINNAGIIQPFVPVAELDDATINRVLNINFYGTLYMTQSFLPYLLKRPEAHLANVSSIGGVIPFPGQTIYSASKAAVKVFTEGLYAELKDTSVGVTIIHPGAVNTNIAENSGLESMRDESNSKDQPTHKTLPADQAARKMIDAIEKNKMRVIVGSDARMLDIFYRIYPKMAINMIVKQMQHLLKK